jgi:tRNA A-37 threonylcarbamoyl transferase component Bud32
LSPTHAAKTWTKTADRPLRSTAKSLSIWLFAHFVGVAVPWRSVRQTDGSALLAFEHTRLKALAAAGERVPPVLAFDGHTLQTGDIGPTLDQVLHRTPEAGRLVLMCAASADLARFHARGQWHGGAQTRNLTWDGEHFARLDFEERLQPGMPLATVQVYDVLQLVLSLERHLDALGSQAVLAVLNAYEQASRCSARGATAPPDLLGFLRRLLPRLLRVSRMAAWSSRLDGSRELRRLRTVLDGVAAFVEQSSGQAL